MATPNPRAPDPHMYQLTDIARSRKIIFKAHIAVYNVHDLMIASSSAHVIAIADMSDRQVRQPNLVKEMLTQHSQLAKFLVQLPVPVGILVLCCPQLLQEMLADPSRGSQGRIIPRVQDVRRIRSS